MNPSPGDLNAFTIAAYMRVTSLAIAAYDYLETQPTAWRFYREHWESKRLTISVLLFSLLRSLSIVTLTISNIGFFYSHFTQATCSRFYLFPPAFKASVGGNALPKNTAGWGCPYYCYGFESHERSCRAVNQVKVLGAYLFYAIAMIYDTITTSVSVLYLVKFKLSTTNSV
ncbi:hypothetical protein CVT26_006217 [Gymnopilus dilepis]|uniref:Uncharacterized protein n=1 Tax=Gymnopilus dilepis TaxID=231916 RepID=A0A409Y1B9_9AGAR|nr:hypothetical protein CVT26_006217 [Gymnopilus dilepis]